MPGPLFWPLLPLHLLALTVLLIRAAFSGLSGPVARGIIDSLRRLPEVWRERRDIQATRTASIADVARWLIWNPLTYLRRAPVSIRQ
jgi:hypothetical protein